MSAEYDRLVADIATNAPGAIPSTVEAELMVVLRDFLQHTAAWKADFEMPVQPDRTCYVLQPPRGVQVHLLFMVYNSTDTERRPLGSTGGVRMNVPGQIEFRIAPSAAATYVARVSLYPVADDNGSAASCRAAVPGHILSEYYDTLFQGILSRLQAQMLKGYSSPQMAIMRQKLYREGRSIAKADIARSHVWGGQQWQYPVATTAMGRQNGA